MKIELTLPRTACVYHKIVLCCFVALGVLSTYAQDTASHVWRIPKTSDFTISGDGGRQEWRNTAWLQLQPAKGPTGGRVTRVKMLYSSTGMYFLFECEDQQITSTMNADFMDLWKEDVVELFLHTDTNTAAYFEYELSPRNFELPLLISNVNGELRRWMPFYYEANRKTIHKTTIRREGNRVVGWTAECFIPYTLLSPLANHIPATGTRWRANFYRVDYDSKQYASWLWQPVRTNFHDFKSFGVVEFE